MGWGKDKWRLEVLDVRRRREEEQGAEGEEVEEQEAAYQDGLNLSWMHTLGQGWMCVCVWGGGASWFSCQTSAAKHTEQDVNKG